VCFLAVEDADGMVNVVVAPEVYDRCRQAAHSAFVLVDGVLDKRHKAINVVAREIVQL
jgi:DNA polymerase III alpha subunit